MASESVAAKGSSFSFGTVEHKIAAGFTYLAKGLKYTAEKVIPSIQAEAPVIEGLTALVSPQSEAIERAAFTALGQVLAPINAADSAAAVDGLDVHLDAATVADFKAFLAEFKSDLAGVGISL